MAIGTRPIEYQHNDVPLEGTLAFDKERKAKQPAVLVLHGMEGHSEEQVDFAMKLAQWGYVGFAADFFGKSLASTAIDELQRLMMAFMEDRALLQDRVLHILEVVKGLPEVDADRIAAMGFCFGGLCVLDLARTGVDVRAIASFHGVLRPPGETSGNNIKARVIVFHGWDDPFAPAEDVVALGRELSDRETRKLEEHRFDRAAQLFTETCKPAVAAPCGRVVFSPTSVRHLRSRS